MKVKQHGYGIVEFIDVIEIDKFFLSNYIKYLQKINPSPFEIVEENGKHYAINKGGFKFNIEDISSAPNRYNVLFSENDIEYKEFISRLDGALYNCLIEYCKIFPDAAKTIWWKTQGHIAHYSAGQLIGPHSDSHIEFDFKTKNSPTNQAPIYNTVSSGVYLNSSTQELDEWSFCGGEMYFEQADYLFSPKAGSIIMYPSNYIGRHEVKPVTKGNRYVYLQFFSYGIPNNVDGRSVTWLDSLSSDIYMEN